jgi:signal peptidase I
MSYDPFGDSAEDLPEPHRHDQEPAPPDAAPGPASVPAGGGSADDYVEVPASLELSYTQSDLGLSPLAYEDAYPYGRAPRPRRATGIRMRRVTRELAETVILALLIFFSVKAVVQNFRVEGASMQPSLETKQYLLVNKAIYFRVNMDRIHRFLPFVPEDGDGVRRHLFRAPRRGDVIVFHFPCEKNREFIKRVIGVPGDTVEIRDSQVFINGGPLVEDFTSGPPNYTYGPRTVPPGHYFVLGDNRVNSFDSHTWGTSCTARPEAERDFVPEENIIGQAWLSYWPWEDLGFINNRTLKPQAE